MFQLYTDIAVIRTASLLNNKHNETIKTHFIEKSIDFETKARYIHSCKHFRPTSHDVG